MQLLTTMNIFCAIDFETADAQRDSACAIGLARAEDGQIVYRDAALIRPPRGMSPACQAVHGLTWDRVKDAPPFAEVWAKMAPVLNGATRLVAHNVPFDKSVLEACCRVAKLDAPRQQWVCTLALARKKWPKPYTNKLPDVCHRLGITFSNHHDAGADAEAAARIMIALDRQSEVEVKAEPVAVELPRTEVGAILSRIPEWQRTESVRNLMRDAEMLGPKYAADLVGYVAAWFARAEPGRYRCNCGAYCSVLCALCVKCVAKLPYPEARKREAA